MNIKKLASYIVKYVLDADFRFLWNSGCGKYDKMPDEEYLSLKFQASMGKPLNLENPQTFNEKLQWLKLYDRRPEYTMMVDKYKVREYIAQQIGEEYLIPLLGVWDDPDDIDFDSLPNQFVLKCNHNSGLGMCICKDKSKLDMNKVKKELRKGLKQDYYLTGREWPYKDVPRKIICEKYMEDSSTAELRDYKFFCFGGAAKCYKVDFDRFIGHNANYFTADGELMKLGEEVCPPDFEKTIQTPANFEKMKELAAKLSETHSFLRADFYDVDGKVYFGELTFYPASGFGKFIYEGNDVLLGSWIKLPESCGGGYILIYGDMLCVLNTATSKPHEGRTQNSGLADYKIHSFNGLPRVILVCRDRFSEMGFTEDFFDEEWTHLNVQREKHPNSCVLISRPKELDKMLELAETLSKGMPFLRSDFYMIDGKVYFGELTFFPASGFEKFVPETFDKGLGDWIILPSEAGELTEKW